MDEDLTRKLPESDVNTILAAIGSIELALKSMESWVRAAIYISDERLKRFEVNRRLSN